MNPPEQILSSHVTLEQRPVTLFARLRPSLLAIATAMVVSLQAGAQDDRPAPDHTRPQDIPLADPASDTTETDGRSSDDPQSESFTSRRPAPDDVIPFALEEIEVKDLISFIARTTGKVVIVQPGSQVLDTEVTIVNDEPRDAAAAIDLLFTAMRIAGVIVIEQPDVIILASGESGEYVDVGRLPVLTSVVDVMTRTDLGTAVIKIFNIENALAADIMEAVSATVPEWGRIQADQTSNQIVVVGDIALCQQVQRMIKELDKVWTNRRLHTFRLAHADAEQVKLNIEDLFLEDGQTGSSSSRTRTQGNATASSRSRSPGSSSSSSGVSGETPLVELRLTVNPQQNTLTVQAEPKDMEEIATLIMTEWDLPRPVETFRVYELQYTDPRRLQQMLTDMLGDGSSTSGGVTAPGSNRAGGRSASTSATTGLADIYQIQAYPDRNALVVLSKTPETFPFIDALVEQLDQPAIIGMPFFIPLKHANASDLAVELNTLLADSGTRVEMERPAEGIAGGFDFEGDGAGASDTTDSSQGAFSFPWQSASSTLANDAESSPESALIGKIRIVPIVRRNALAILSPPSFRPAIEQLVDDFDQPGRQVMITATLVEVQMTDQLNLGLRAGSGNLAATEAGGEHLATSGSIDLGSLFTSSTFSLGVIDVNLVLDALQQLTNTRVIQEPRIYTADNEEAMIFSGEEVPIATGSVTSGDFGGTTTTIDYKGVGVGLNVRPRITAEGGVDLEVFLELSKDTGRTGVDNSAIFDRQQISSHIVLLDGQTVVIGGLLKETETKVKRKIPGLGDIPLLGGLFQYTDDATIQYELLAFITPTIVERPDVNDVNYNREFRRRLSEVTRPLADQMADDSSSMDIQDRVMSDQLQGRHSSEHRNGYPYDPDLTPTQDNDE